MVDIARKLVFRGPFEIKTVMERVLRNIFASDRIDERYRYNPIEENTKIKIFRSYPQRMEFYPCIILEAGPHDASIMAVGEGQELASEQFTSGSLSAVTFTGYVRIPINVKIFARTGDDRDILTSILTIILRIISRNEFVEFGWNKIRIQGDRHQVDGKHILYTNIITVDAHTDYTLIEDIDQDLLIDKCTAEIIPVLQFIP